MSTFVIATRNLHKVEEIRGILGSDYEYLTLQDFPAAPQVVEDAATFAGNATKKAVELAKWLASKGGAGGVTPAAHVLADDSGLEVDALDGAPGVHSARFAATADRQGTNSPDADNNARLLSLMADVPAEGRTARFRCVIALTPVLPPQAQGASPVCAADEFEVQTRLFEGKCEGRLGFWPRGKGGFGYDPLFIPDGYQQTFAELGAEVKNLLSHRARALASLKRALAAG